MELGFQGAQEQAEANRRAATAKRVKALAAILALALGARFLVKDPPKRQAPTHQNKPVRALPGLVNALPDSEKSKLDFQTLSRLRQGETDELARFKAKKDNGPDAVVAPTLAPSVPTALNAEPRLAKPEVKMPNIALTASTPASPQQLSLEAIRRMIRTPRYTYEPAKVASNGVVVVFRSGGRYKARDFIEEGGRAILIIDQKMAEALPRGLIKSVERNAEKWAEPIPRGFVQLKPAPGITVVIADRIASRITVKPR